MKETIDWRSSIDAAYEPAAFDRSQNAFLPPIPDSPRSYQFLHLLRPLVEAAFAELKEGLAALADRHGDKAPFRPAELATLFFKPLVVRLFNLLARCAVRELGLARLEGRLKRASREERFEEFVESLAGDPGRAKDFLLAYPVLARMAVVLLDDWKSANLELASRLAGDWPEIAAAFGLAPEDELAELTPDVGDLHRRGRAVAILTFTSGRKLVYKPKDLEIDRQLKRFAAWLAERGAPSLRLAEVLCRADYGWVEFIPHTPCADRREAEIFYRRLGGWLALMWALRADDFHGENLIACGPDPVPIDCESFFSQETLFQALDEPIQKVMLDSVLRVGLLPQPIYGRAGNAADLSGMGASGGGLSFWSVPYWENEGTDEMRLKRSNLPLAAAENKPKLEDRPLNVLDFRDPFQQGFQKTYAVMAEHRAEILAPGGPLSWFAGCRVRIIARNTLLYALIRAESRHPSAMAAEEERERLLDRLHYVSARPTPKTVEIVGRLAPLEKADLQREDIPFFTRRVDSRDFEHQTAVLPDYFPCSALDAVRERIARLDAAVFEQQRWFIDSSLGVLAVQDELRWPSLAAARTVPAVAPGPEDLVAEALAIGERLAATGLAHAGTISWLGIEPRAKGGWALAPVGLDLYSGRAGIALFLAYLARISGDGRYADIARQCVRGIRQDLLAERATLNGVGAFSGWGSLVHAFIHLAAALDEPSLLAEAEDFGRRLEKEIENEKSFDLITGLAGGILALEGLVEATGGAAPLPAMERLGRRLLEQSLADEGSRAWRMEEPGQRPLTGLSHGASGAALALAKLYRRSGDETFRRAAEEALEFERRAFVAEEGNWPDYRYPEKSAGRPFCGLAWCHGAPGIGLARLALARYLPSPGIEEDLRLALAATAGARSANFSLCHGELGNLELLLAASRERGDAPLARRLASRVAEAYRDLHRRGWVTGVPLGLESPGLMVGLAGIGYGLLRLAHPDAVPSLLLLEPPPERTRAPSAKLAEPLPTAAAAYAF